MKKISTLNMKSDRSVKCEKQLYAKCEQVLVSSMTSQTVNLANLVDLVSFFRHFWDIGGGGSTFQRIQILGSATIFRENVQL